MQKETQLKSCYKKSLSSPNTHHSSSRCSPHGQMRDIVAGVPNASLYPGLQISRMTSEAGGFTLIELLVVVLIIGILAAVAVPQYQKAVEKSKASQAFVVLKSVQQAFEAYRLANGEYPTKFEDTAISLPSMTGNVAFLQSVGGNIKDTISDKDWSLQIQTDSPSGEGTYYLVMMSRITGKYQGGNLMLHFVAPTVPEREGKIICNERFENAVNFPFTQPAGSYCQNILKGTFLSGNSFNRNYSL